MPPRPSRVPRPPVLLLHLGLAGGRIVSETALLSAEGLAEPEHAEDLRHQRARDAALPQEWRGGHHPIRYQAVKDEHHHAILVVRFWGRGCYFIGRRAKAGTLRLSAPASSFFLCHHRVMRNLMTRHESDSVRPVLCCRLRLFPYGSTAAHLLLPQAD